MIACAPITVESCTRPRRLLQVLTLTPFYPTQQDDGEGCFVAEPLVWTARLGITNSVLSARPAYRRTDPVDSAFVAARSQTYWSVPGNWGLASAGRFLARSILSNIEHLRARHAIDLIHAHGALPCGQAAMSLKQRLGIPFVVTAHGLDVFSSVQAKGLAGSWCKSVSLEVYGAAERVICVSERVREQVLRASHCVKTEVVYNGVDAARFAPGSKRDDSLVVLSIGNLIPIKGHESLLRATAQLGALFPALILHIVGNGPEIRHLKELSAELGIIDRVRFFGRLSRDSVAAAIRGCTVFALPSTFEALGCVYLEAMATGKPVIACAGQGISEIINHGENGWLIPPGSVEDLASALMSLLMDAELRRRLGAAARQTVVQRFTLGHQAARLAQLYRECAS